MINVPKLARNPNTERLRDTFSKVTARLSGSSVGSSVTLKLDSLLTVKDSVKSVVSMENVTILGSVWTCENKRKIESQEVPSRLKLYAVMAMKF